MKISDEITRENILMKEEQLDQQRIEGEIAKMDI